MKTILNLMLAASMLLLHLNPANAQTFKVKNYKVTVQGTSSLHDWESVAEKAECKGAFTSEKNLLTNLSGVIVKIPVVSIKSPKGKIMDNKTYEAFDSDKNPYIVFTLSSEKISTGFLDMKGTLSMAGVTKTIDVTAAYKVLSNGDLQVTGTKKLSMTDFKMEPPTAMMGTIKVGNDVVVTFDFVLSNINPNL